MAISDYLPSYLVKPAGPAKNEIFSSQNLDQQGNVIYSTDHSPDPAAPKDKPKVAESKTVDPKDFRYTPSAENNILNKYRSWTYNFSVGAIDPVAVADVSLVATSIKKYNVVNTAGKGTAGLGISAVISNTSATNQADVAGVVGGFNKNSAGRFDLFMDNVVINSIIGAGSPETGSSQATNISFDVFEPYSMNGFIEALQAASRAAGYTDYMKAVFAIQVEFRGYPDNQPVETARAEVIPNSTRYFIITISSVEVTVSEQGTQYKVSCVPTNQMGFGSTNVLTTDIQLAGNTIGDVLANFFKAINQMVQDAAEKENGNKNCDLYLISCPKLSSKGNKQDVQAAILVASTNGVITNAYHNDMVKASINDGLKETNVFKPADPAQFKNGYVGAKNFTPSTEAKPTNKTEDQSTGKAIPKSGTVAFAMGQQIHDCIAAVVRDSNWVRDKVLSNEALAAAKQKGSDGMLPYFTVRLEVSLGDYDPIGNKYFKTYRYVLEPYMIHYTRIPGQEQGTTDISLIKGQVKRSYNYIYTGKNTDVLKFNLKFDNLYFSAIPAMLGNRPAGNQPAAAAAADGTQKITMSESEAAKNAKSTSANSVPTASVQRTADAGKRPDTVAGQPQEDPYYRMAQGLHMAVLEGVDLLKGEIEILGDPYFLVTGGMATQNLELADPYITKNGEAAVTQGDLFVNINFRNPIDINTSGPQAGMMQFDPNLISFSGVYRLLTLKSSFKDQGKFIQTLDIVRVPGQVLSKEDAVTAKDPVTVALPGAQQIKDAAADTVNKLGKAANSFNLNTLLGDASAGIKSFASNIRLSASGLSSIPGVTELNSAAASVSAAGETFKNITANATAATDLSKTINTAAQNAGNIPNNGWGAG